MTDEEINRAIAEVLDLEIERRTRRGKPDPNGVQLWYLIEHHGGVATWRKLPNYCNDLNAMHEAEKMLPPNLWTAMENNLYPADDGHPLHFSARERAVAFLKTIGKWKD
jgi:hypothetical protein